MSKLIKDSEYYQDKIDLTPNQAKAFTALKRAAGRCRKEHIKFYMCLDTLGALNGNNVHRIGGDDDTEFRGLESDAPNCLQYKSYPTVETECSFADDNHYVLLHDE